MDRKATPEDIDIHTHTYRLKQKGLFILVSTEIFSIQIEFRRNTMGRPAKYKTVEELEKKCDEYFRVCDEHTITIVMKGKKGKPDTIITKPDPQPYTSPGLALALGFCDRSSLDDYKNKKKFFPTIKKARSRIEEQRVTKALRGQHNPVFSIFDLKNNFGYKDKTETEISGPGGGPIALTAIPPTPTSLAQWEQMVLESQKVRQIKEKTKPTSNQKDDS